MGGERNLDRSSIREIPRLSYPVADIMAKLSYAIAVFTKITLPYPDNVLAFSTMVTYTSPYDL